MASTPLLDDVLTNASAPFPEDNSGADCRLWVKPLSIRRLGIDRDTQHSSEFSNLSAVGDLNHPINLEHNSLLFLCQYSEEKKNSKTAPPTFPSWSMERKEILACTLNLYKTLPLF